MFSSIEGALQRCEVIKEEENIGKQDCSRSGYITRHGLFCWHVEYSYIMMTSSNGNIFRVTGPLCGEFTGPGEFPTQRPVTRSFDVYFDLRLNKRLSKQPWGWWFETLSWSLWRHVMEIRTYDRNGPTRARLRLRHDLDNDLFNLNTIRYISMACNKEYFMVCGERIPQRFIELQINKTVNTFNKHSFNISST